MSLDVYLEDDDGNCLYNASITHNLGKMADAAGIYQHVWRPEELGITKARDLIEPVVAGLQKMVANPAHYEQYNAPNGWGLYKHFVPWLVDYVRAMREHPNAKVRVWR